MAHGRLGAVLLVAVFLISGCGMFDGSGDPSPGVTAPAQDLLDLAYATTSPAQTLDLLLPRRTGTAIPVVVAIHGGAWQGGDKGDLQWMVTPLREAGYAVASINYRLSPEAIFPAAIEDAVASVRWLRAHAREYGLDPGRFAAWGFSAGGTLAALLGVAPGDAGGSTPSSAGSGPSGAVQAVVDFYGPSDLLAMDGQFAQDGHCPGTPQHHDAPDSPESRWLGQQLPTVPELAARASPVSYLAGATSLPPFYLAHGIDDCVVPDAQSAELAKGLRARGARAELVLVPGFGHADLRFDQEQAPAAIAFLGAQLKPARS